MRQAWEIHLPRADDYWPTFSAPYRAKVTEAVDKVTPVNGSILDFGCGPGVQAFLIRQRRPDLYIDAVDINVQARNLTQVLLGGDERLQVTDTPSCVEAMPTVDTILSVFTCAYQEPIEIGRLLTAFTEKAKVIVLAEPTNLDNPPLIQMFNGMPCAGYVYPYGEWLTYLGWRVEQILLEAPDHLNAITIATKGDSHA